MKTFIDNIEAYWLALLWAPAMSWSKVSPLLDAGLTVDRFFKEKPTVLRQFGVPETVLAYIQTPNWPLVEKHLRWAEEKNHHIITIENPNYPQLLKEIHDSPLVLFVKGDPTSLNQHQIAMVGSRKPTPSGNETAYQLARELAELGITVTSGLAYGIDIASHRGALAGNGKTLAILGAGLDKLYPRAHAQTAEQITHHGALISEFPLGTPPVRTNFPRRNRIITGMSLGTIVVEATMKSGTLISARCAVEQNREVFAIPNSIHARQSEGCHYLIKNGAKLLANMGDLLEELPILNKNTATPQNKTNCKIRVDESDMNLLECIGFDSTDMDTILKRSNQPLSEISPKLLNFELLGLICSLPGGYARVE